MAKGIKPTKSKEKTDKQKLWEARKEYHESVPDSERNPTHKEDFEKVLSKLFPPIRPKKPKRS